MRIDDECVIIFVRAPIKGQVKTRLAKDFGETATLGLYRNFVRDIIQKVTEGGHTVKIFYDPPDSEQLIKKWLGNQFEIFPQTGSDLGEKMTKSFKQVFRTGIKRAVLIGTDLPDLPEKTISRALIGLLTHDAAIGPARDGGYYLIGFREDSFMPAVFEGIVWSTPTVFEKTMNVFARSRIKLHQLQKWRDIDTYDDLTDLIRYLKNNPESAKNTHSFLKHLQII